MTAWSDGATARLQLHEAIQASASTDDDLEGTVLIGWIAVAEWMDRDGKRWISRIGAPADPAATLPEWQGQGYLHHALCGNWGDP